MTKRYCLILLAMLSCLAACSNREAPNALYTTPLADWRAVQPPRSGIAIPDGRIISWPHDEAVGCSSLPAASGQWPRCLFAVNAANGYLVGFDRRYEANRLQVTMDLEPGSYPSYRNMARGNEDQWAPGNGPDPTRKTPYEGAVRGRLAGNVDGRAYWAGCWRYYDGYPFPYGCMVAVDLGNDGAATGEFATVEPPGEATYEPSRADIERAVRTIAAVRSSFGYPQAH
jgi:hypothetical protein